MIGHLDLVVHHLLPRHRPGCGICGRPGYDLLCERCGAPFHGDCYWTMAPAAERTYFEMSAPEASYTFVCRACRS